MPWLRFKIFRYILICTMETLREMESRKNVAAQVNRVALGLGKSCEQKELCVRLMCCNAHQLDNYLQGRMFEYLIPSWWPCLGRIVRCGLVGESVLLAWALMFQKSEPFPASLLSQAHSPCLNINALSLCSSTMHVCLML